MVQTLPDDTMVDVLSRLSAKCLNRFRCVSKSWFALICPHFFRLNSHRQKLLLMYKEHCSILDCHETAFDSDLNPTSVTIESLFQSRPENPMIITSCDSWLLVASFDYSRLGYKLFLLNPFTIQCREFQSYRKRIPKRDGLGIFYDYFCNDYMVVTLGDLRNNLLKLFFSVFSFKTNSWTENNYLPDWVESIWRTDGVSVNGAPHWFYCKRRTSRRGILRFDLKNEFIEIPHILDAYNWDYYEYLILASLRGNLCVHGHSSGAFMMLEMKKYGVKESWTLVCKINFLPHYSYLKPWAFTKKAELIVTAPEEKELVIYNVQGNSSKSVMKFEEEMGPRMEGRVATFAESAITLNCDCRVNRSSISSVKQCEGNEKE